MEDYRNKIFSNRAESNVIMYIGTVIFASITILIGYFLRRYTRYRDELDSTKDTTNGEQNQGIDSRDSCSGSASTSNVNKRTKNKRRREVQQEFSHSWVVGTLKGHTSNIFNMSFSSNGKQLASCAEDCKRPNGMMTMMETVEAAVAATMEVTGKASTLPTTIPSYSYAPNRRNINVSASIGRYRELSNKFAECDGGMKINRQTGTAAATTAASAASAGKMYRQAANQSRNCHWVSHSDYQHQQRQQQHQQQQQLYIPEYNQNKNVCKLNHYQQKARNVYFHQLYVQLMSVQQSYANCRSIVPQQQVYLCPNIYHQQLSEQLAGQLAGQLARVQLKGQLGQIDIGTNDHQTLYCNGVSPYWIEGRYPSKSTYGFVQTKRDEFIINDTILEYVLRTYVHHPLYLIEAGYPCAWNFDARFKQFVNNLHKPFVSKNQSNNTTNNLLPSNKIDNDGQQNRDCVRSSSFTSSSRRAYINETMMRQRSSSISTVGELNVIETRCSMCLKGFYLYRANGNVDRREVCVHHPGDLIFNNKDKVKTWTCCKNRASVLGCKTESSHIWKSFKKNFASPQIDYVRTKPSEIQPENRIYGIYGIDCEMVTTQNGLELAKVSLVNIHGHVVYNEYVIPRSKVIDYNTRFSGITPNKLATATKTLQMVQQDLLEFIKAETILIGHALENDLKVLRMIHYTCIDTALLLKHPDDLPFRHSLRVLSKGYLNRIIQNGAHNSVEDTLSALDLVLFKLRDDGF